MSLPPLCEASDTHAKDHYASDSEVTTPRKAMNCDAIIEGTSFQETPHHKRLRVDESCEFPLSGTGYSEEDIFWDAFVLSEDLLHSNFESLHSWPIVGDEKSLLDSSHVFL